MDIVGLQTEISNWKFSSLEHYASLFFKSHIVSTGDI